MPQTTYSDERGLALLGALVDSGPNEIVTRFSAAAIPFGRFVSKASGDDSKVALPAATGDVTGQGALQGVAIRTQAIQTDLSVPLAQYAAKDAINVLKDGRVYMYAEQTVTPTDPVFVRFTANGATGLVGQVRKDADTARAVQFTGARYVSSADAGDLVAVEFSIP